jgi:acetyltransferase-like isoleucine patch superfamily enzyme
MELIIMDVSKRKKFTFGELFLFDCLGLTIESTLYICSLTGPVYLLWKLKFLHPIFLLVFAVLGYTAAAFTFTLLIILLTRLFLHKIPTGRLFFTNKKVIWWSFAHMFRMIMERSMFFSTINGHILFRQLFYKGMGAKIDWTVILGPGAKLVDPWEVKIGPHTLIGQEAIIAGHKIEHDIVTMGPVEIGVGVLIGARAIVQPGVKIGDGVIIGANSVVVRGSIISAGETWAGNPACKVDLFLHQTITKPIVEKKLELSDTLKGLQNVS